MSFIFKKNDGTILNDSDLLKMRSELLGGGEIGFEVFSDRATVSPGIYLKRSSTSGEIQYPIENNLSTDYNDIIHWGSLAEPKGLFVKIEEEWVAFSLENGSSYRNKILLPQAVLDNPGSFSVKLKFIGNDAADTRRLYIGVEIDDS